MSSRLIRMLVNAKTMLWVFDEHSSIPCMRAPIVNYSNLSA